jgi:hypothetical protein
VKSRTKALITEREIAFKVAYVLPTLYTLFNFVTLDYFMSILLALRDWCVHATFEVNMTSLFYLILLNQGQLESTKSTSSSILNVYIFLKNY